MTPPTDPEPIPCTEVKRPWRPLVTVCLLAGSWAVAVFVLQEYTTGSDYPLPLARTVGSRIIRFLLDVLACDTAVFWLRNWPLYLAVLFNGCGALILVVYHEYFGRTLSLTIIREHFGEGLIAASFAADLIRWQSFTIIVLAVLVLVAVARWVDRNRLPRDRRTAIGAWCLIGYLVLAYLAAFQIDRVRKLRTFGTVDRVAMTNGYLLTWYGEYRYLNADVLLRKAMRAADTRSDRLSPAESLVPLAEKVAVIQVESLDDSVLDFEVAGQPVMPFLHELSTRSMRFRVAAIHISGSCDSDFVMLMNLYPIGDVCPYRVPRFDFSRSLALLAREQNYRSVFLHGNDRSFFARGDGVKQMGFDTTLFREELESQYGLTAGGWGISDKDVFTVSSRLLNQDNLPALHFIITLTSHGPYHFLRPEECELFPSASGKREHYFNSMRYVDNQLKTYIESLPDSTVVIMYGDHTSRVDYGQPSDSSGREYVPFLVVKVGADLAPLQRTRGHEIAISGDLTTLDAAGYVWSLLRARSTGIIVG